MHLENSFIATQYLNFYWNLHYCFPIRKEYLESLCYCNPWILRALICHVVTGLRSGIRFCAVLKKWSYWLLWSSRAEKGLCSSSWETDLLLCPCCCSEQLQTQGLNTPTSLHYSPHRLILPLPSLNPSASLDDIHLKCPVFKTMAHDTTNHHQPAPCAFSGCDVPTAQLPLYQSQQGFLQSRLQTTFSATLMGLSFMPAAEDQWRKL